MNQVELPRDGEPALVFTGVELAQSSSDRGFSRYWTELALFRTRAGAYVFQRVSRTRKPDGYEVFTAKHFDTAPDLLAFLRRKEGRIPGLELALCELASEQDEGILEALEALENQKEEID